jgi:hypothetical protein
VIKKTRFEAVFGALKEQYKDTTCLLGVREVHPSRKTQLQLVNTSPIGIFLPVSGGNVDLSSSGSSLAAWNGSAFSAT